METVRVFGDSLSSITFTLFSVDMHCITEMWLNSDVADAEVSFENYNIAIIYFEETDIVADEEEESLFILNPKFFHAVFTMT